MAADAAPDTSDLTATEAAQLLLSEPDVILLDVREQHEWDAGHAPSATLLPMSQLNERVAELPKDRTLICVCHIGGRSAMVTEALNGAGWHARNLTGGMVAWQAAGLEVIDADGQPGSAD